MSNSYKHPDFDPQKKLKLKTPLYWIVFHVLLHQTLTLELAHVLINRLMNSAALLLGNASVCGQTEVGISMYNYIAHYYIAQNRSLFIVFLISGLPNPYSADH